MKIPTTLIFICLSLFLSAQEIKPSSDFTISGVVKQEIKLSIDDLRKYEFISIDDVEIKNHLGEKKSTATGLKGIPLKRIMEKVQFDVENPKQLSEFYFTFIATDGYKVVFSWNEIFNSATGDHIYIVTEKEGQTISEMKDHILLITTSDFNTGRRQVKALEKIIVSRV